MRLVDSAKHSSRERAVDDSSRERAVDSANTRAGRGPAGALEQGEVGETVEALDEALELSSRETGTVGGGRWVS